MSRLNNHTGAGAGDPSRAPRDWPAPPAAAAYRGVVGDFVRIIEPHSEADPAALLTQFLAYFGSIVGRKPHFRVESDRHGVNEYVCLVGETSKGRKGTSRGRIHGLFEKIEPSWAKERIARGLSTGEGLIWAVRDAMEATEAAQTEGGPGGGRRKGADPGVDDKRLLVLDSEFASTLHVMERSGNTLSPVLRTAWDGEVLRILTKNWPAKASNPHVSIIGHVTKDEVLRYLDRTEVANGFANRFLWIAVRRSKVLPEGGTPSEADLDALQRRLDDVVTWATEVGQVDRSPEARELWASVYPNLSAGLPGLLGAVLARSEAHVLRLATLYALLDRSTTVRRDHLEAALTLWDYAERSARFIFGASLGDPLADELLAQLRRSPGGLTRTEIRDLFVRHGLRTQLDRALLTLQANGLARMVKTPTGGRPEERWFASGPLESGGGASPTVAAPPPGPLPSLSSRHDAAQSEAAGGAA